MDGRTQVKTHRALVVMGGNTGDVAETLRQAADNLNERVDIRIEAQSGRHTTPAVGSAAGDSFLNGAMLLATSLAPLELLDVLQQTENRHGRVRSIRWGPRTLDLDLICHGDLVLDTKRLTLPHSACWYRRFVLEPVEEIAGDWIHPVLRLTFRELRERLLPRPLPVAIPDHLASSDVLERIRNEFPQVAWVDAEAAAAIRFTSDTTNAPFSLPLPATDTEQFLRDTLRAATGE